MITIIGLKYVYDLKKLNGMLADMPLKQSNMRV